MSRYQWMDKRGNLHLNGGLVPPLGFFEADPSLVSAMAASVRDMIVLVPEDQMVITKITRLPDGPCTIVLVPEQASAEAETRGEILDFKSMPEKHAQEPAPIPARPSSPSPAAEPRGMRVNRRGRK